MKEGNSGFILRAHVKVNDPRLRGQAMVGAAESWCIALAKFLSGFSRIGRQEAMMLYYALIFLVIAIIAGLLGFGAIAFAATGIAKILFFLFLVLFLISLIRHLGRGRMV